MRLDNGFMERLIQGVVMTYDMHCWLKIQLVNKEYIPTGFSETNHKKGVNPLQRAFRAILVIGINWHPPGD